MYVCMYVCMYVYIMYLHCIYCPTKWLTFVYDD